MFVISVVKFAVLIHFCCIVKLVNNYKYTFTLLEKITAHIITNVKANSNNLTDQKRFVITVSSSHIIICHISNVTVKC